MSLTIYGCRVLSMILCKFREKRSWHIVANTKGKLVSLYPTSNTAAAFISRSSGCPFSSLFFLQNFHINNRSCYCPEYVHIKLNRKHRPTVTIQIHKPLNYCNRPLLHQSPCKGLWVSYNNYSHLCHTIRWRPLLHHWLTISAIPLVGAIRNHAFFLCICLQTLLADDTVVQSNDIHL